MRGNVVCSIRCIKFMRAREYEKMEENTANLFCWFDWDDNTTSVNSIKIIKEPRKGFLEYKKGDEVVAKLPKFGLWKGVIVEIGESKKELESEMDKRQKLQLAAHQDQQDHDKFEDGNSEEEECTEITVSSPLRKRKRSKSTNQVKKVSSEADEEKVKEKKRKKEIDLKKLEVANKSLENIISRRRNDLNEVPNQTAADSQECTPDQVTCTDTDNYQELLSDNDKLHMPELPTQSAFMDFNQQPRMTSSGINQGLDHLYGYMHPGQSVQYVNYPGYERPYNYSISTMQTHAEQISLLQQENAALRAENQMLIQELQHSNSCSNIGLEATPRKIHFLQNLCTALEQKMHYRGYNSTITSNKESEVLHESTVNMPTLVRPKSRRLAFTESSARHDHEESPFTENAARHEHGERQPSTHREEDFEPERGSTEGDTKRNGCSQAYWEQRVTMNGALKVRLIPESEVYLTAQQLSQCIQKAGTNARKLIINFLDVFFKREVLAISSAKGKRVAHNSKLADSGEKTEALPEEVLNAIKRFTEKHIRKITGQFSLTDAVMNNVINSKCATARRALHNSNV